MLQQTAYRVCDIFKHNWIAFTLLMQCIMYRYRQWCTSFFNRGPLNVMVLLPAHCGSIRSIWQIAERARLWIFKSELISYCCSSCSSCGSDLFKITYSSIISNGIGMKIWQDCSSSKYALIDGSDFRFWRHTFKMAAMTSFHTEVVTEQEASARYLCSSVRRRFLIYSTFAVVNINYIGLA